MEDAFTQIKNNHRVTENTSRVSLSLNFLIKVYQFLTTWTLNTEKYLLSDTIFA